MRRRFLMFSLGVACLVLRMPVASAQENADKPADKIMRLDPPELGFFSKELVYQGIPINRAVQGSSKRDF